MKKPKEKIFSQVIKEFHIGFVVGHLFSFTVWSLLQKFTHNSVLVFPWYYISLCVSYCGLWFQLLVVYLLGYRKSKS